MTAANIHPSPLFKKPLALLFRDGEPVLDDTPQRVHAIAPANLFAFLIGSPAVGDTYFIHTPPVTRHFDGDFRLTAEPVLLKRKRLKDLAAKGFIACLHVVRLTSATALHS